MWLKLVVLVILLATPLISQISIGREVRHGTVLPATCRLGLLFVKTDDQEQYLCSPVNTWILVGPSVGGGSPAPSNATYITQTPNGTLSAEQPLNALSDGLLKHASGVVSSLVPGSTNDLLTINAGGAEAYTNIFTGITDGMAIDRVDLTIVNTAGTLYMEVEAMGGGDVDFIWGGVTYTLDCTTGAGTAGKARVALTAGADANNPVKNYVSAIISGAAAVLQAGTSAPSGTYAWVGSVTVPDATTFDANGVYQFQRYSESLVVTTLGALHHQREKLRSFDASWESGANPTLDLTVNAGAADNVHLDTAAGVVKQLHDQTWPAFDDGPYYYGNGTAPYDQLTDLNAALSTDSGASMSGKRFNLVIWGAVNKATSDCKLYVNLPSDSYNTDSNAQADVNNTSNYNIPSDFKGVGFLIARLVLRHQVTASGTWTEIETIDLRGLPPGTLGGGTSSTAATAFSDALFQVFDDGDPTKILMFQVSGLTTATTRTITIPDASGTMALTSNILGDFAATTSAELASVLSDETGTAGGFLRATTSSTVGQVLRIEAGPLIAFGALDLADGDAVTNVLPEANLPNASLTAQGVVELATGAETNTGIDATRAVTPDGLDDWTGSPQITTLGTIDSGVWSGTSIVDAKVDDDITITSVVDQAGDWPAGLTAVELGYVADVTGLIQAQLDLKAPLASPVLTGTVDTGGAQLELPNGAAPTTDGVGEIGVDTTSGQVQVHDGTAERAISPLIPLSFVIPAPEDSDDINLMKAPYGMTMDSIDCIVQGTTSVTGQIQECASDGTSCADLDSDIICDADGAADDGTLTDSSIASGGWLRWKTTEKSGTPTFLTVTVQYRVTPD